MNEQHETDARYMSLIVNAIRVSANYRPKLGHGGEGVELSAFIALYNSDPFYSWLGLNSPIVYAAHKAAGGMTSIYRQLGTGCERLFRMLLQDTLGLTAAQSSWEYRVPTVSGGERILRLDGRINLDELPEDERKTRVNEWLDGFRRKLDVKTEIRGAVFEVRQGYKSKDSKRQNADLANAANAYTQRYLPVLVVK
jgi:hypothetical protein